MGRPLGFDRDEKVLRAMVLFWRKGYDAVSLQGLLNELKINNSSFYHAFGSKEALFDEALDYYFSKIGAHRVQPLLDGKTVHEKLRGYFDRLIELNMSKGGPSGCLVANSSILASSTNKMVARKVKRTMAATKERLAGAFARMLTEGIERGEVKAGVDPNYQARLLVTLVFGMNLVARVGPNRQEMEEIADAAIAMCVLRR